MKNIVLLCAGGMSTSILVNKIKEKATEANFDLEIAAYGISEAPNVVPAADLVLLGPQVRFSKGDLEKKFPDAKIEVIDMRAYGMMDGDAVLKTIQEKTA